MKTILTRLLALTFAVVTLLVFPACKSHKQDDGGYIINASNAETPADEITAFYNGNQAALESLVKHMMKSRSFLSYNYYNRMVDYDKGTMKFSVQKQTKYGGAWADTSDEPAQRLVAVKFVGTVSFDPTVSQDAVVFTPRLAVAGKTLSLIYCKSDEAKALLEAGKYHKGYTVTLTPIEGDWYCAEAIPVTE